VKTLLTKAMILIIATGTLIALPAANAAVRVPKTTWPACEPNGNDTYCVEAVTVTTARGKTINLTWVPDGKEVPQSTNSQSYLLAIRVNKKTNLVTSQGWWYDKYSFEMEKKATHLNVTSLIGTSKFPEHGAKYDPATQSFDLFRNIDWWTEPVCTKWISKESSTATTPLECWKGMTVRLVDNVVTGMNYFSTAASAQQHVDAQADWLTLDGTELVTQGIEPVYGSTYDPTTKTFSKTQPIVIPGWLKDNLLINGGSILGLPGSAPDTSTITNPISVAGRSLIGRWTHPNWNALGLGTLGYGGLFVDAKTANEFVNHVFVDVLPANIDSLNKVSLAAQASSPKYATNLDSDITVSVRLRTGAIKAGVTVGVGTDVTADFQSGGNYSRLTITGNPVTVPLAAKSADCSGETGIAKANVRQLQAILFLNNDGQSAFGAEGTSGDMVVASNGVCDLSTPVWNSETKEFTWTAAAPHFAADGVTPNMGFYKAIIPAADAKILWGLDNPNDAVKALSIQVSTTENGSSAALATVGVKNGKIFIDVSGFGYSRPKLKITLKKSWKPATTMLNKTTITCVMGKSVKKITAVKPTCPKGYKKK
jgi:hypothetical protein